MTQQFFDREAARALCWPRADRLERIGFFHGQAGVSLVASARDQHCALPIELGAPVAAPANHSAFTPVFFAKSCRGAHDIVKTEG